MKEELVKMTTQLTQDENFMQLEEEKRRAELDKETAMMALEEASKNFIKEREEKQKLEVLI